MIKGLGYAGICFTIDYLNTNGLLDPNIKKIILEAAGKLPSRTMNSLVDYYRMMGFVPIIENIAKNVITKADLDYFMERSMISLDESMIEKYKNISNSQDISIFVTRLTKDLVDESITRYSLYMEAPIALFVNNCKKVMRDKIQGSNIPIHISNIPED